MKTRCKTPMISSMKEGTAMVVERAIFELEVLRRAQLFIGSPASTFSFTACLIRGQSRVRGSPLCAAFASAAGLA